MILKRCQEWPQNKAKLAFNSWLSIPLLMAWVNRKKECPEEILTELTQHQALMLVFPKGYHQANVNPPKLTPEEEARRRVLLQSIREHDKKALNPTETDDRSAPLLGGMKQGCNLYLIKVTRLCQNHFRTQWGTECAESQPRRAKRPPWSSWWSIFGWNYAKSRGFTWRPRWWRRPWWRPWSSWKMSLEIGINQLTVGSLPIPVSGLGNGSLPMDLLLQCEIPKVVI